MDTFLVYEMVSHTRQNWTRWIIIDDLLSGVVDGCYEAQDQLFAKQLSGFVDQGYGEETHQEKGCHLLEVNAQTSNF